MLFILFFLRPFSSKGNRNKGKKGRQKKQQLSSMKKDDDFPMRHCSQRCGAKVYTFENGILINILVCDGLLVLFSL